MQFCKISVLGGMVSWKILSVLTKSWESSPGKFDLFLWYFFLLENLLCSKEILDKISWKICDLFLRYFLLLENRMFLQNFEKSLPEILMCSNKCYLSCKIWCVLIKELCLLLENLRFLLHPSLLENLMCSRNLYKKVTPGK